MLYIVELTISEADFTERMHQMRAWLDHRGFEPSEFRFAGAQPSNCRVHFQSQSEAEEFAREFGGRLLYVPPTEGVIR
jgi:hypothetical protein